MHHHGGRPETDHRGWPSPASASIASGGWGSYAPPDPRDPVDALPPAAGGGYAPPRPPKPSRGATDAGCSKVRCTCDHGRWPSHSFVPRDRASAMHAAATATSRRSRRPDSSTCERQLGGTEPTRRRRRPGGSVNHWLFRYARIRWKGAEPATRGSAKRRRGRRPKSPRSKGNRLRLGARANARNDWERRAPTPPHNTLINTLLNSTHTSQSRRRLAVRGMPERLSGVSAAPCRWTRGVRIKKRKSQKDPNQAGRVQVRERIFIRA